MKNPLARTFAGIVLFMGVVSLACNLGSVAPTSAPRPTSASGATVAPAATLPATAAPGGGGGGIASGGCANAYYPVASGDSWTYASNTTTADGAAVSGYTYTTTITTANNNGFSTSTQASTGAVSTVNWDCQGGNLAVLDIGSSTTPSKVKVSVDAVSAVGYNIPAALDTAQPWTETVTITETVQASATKTVNSQVVSQVSCTTAGADTITLPLGKFDTVKALCSKTVVISTIVQGKLTPASTVQASVTDWYAKTVGLVKSVSMIGAAANNSGSTPAPTAITTVTLTHFQVQ